MTAGPSPAGVAVVGFAYLTVPEPDGRTDAELLGGVVQDALDQSGFGGPDIDVLCTASSEFLNGVVGGVMGAFDALPGWPPRVHSHMEGDGAFALYEAWVRLLAGEGEVALVAAFSRPLAHDPSDVLALQVDPYLVGPLQPRREQLAALQARALLDQGRYTEADIAAVTAARRGAGTEQSIYGSLTPYSDSNCNKYASPLRIADCSTVCPGAAAVVLATGAALERHAGAAEPAPGPDPTRRPAWIAGMAHRLERHQLGARPDLADSPSTRAAAGDVGLSENPHLDVLELHAPFAHQELILLDALGAAGKSAQDADAVNPSGGALPADPIMATGLIRIGHAAQAVMEGRAGRAAGHATNGPCLQHNLLCVLEARR